MASLGAPTPLIFPQACARGPHLTIAAVGDVLMHEPLQIKATQQGFESIWSVVIPYISAADIAYANLEGPIAPGVSKTGHAVPDPGHRFDNKVYSSFPLFNYPASLAKALKQSGFDIVSTANNHTLDRFSIGVDKTIGILQRVGLQFTGTRLKTGQPAWVTVINRHGFKIAWIACTANTNGIRDQYHQVLHCYTKPDYHWILHEIEALKNNVDAIIVSPHWGTQYQHVPDAIQVHFAERVLNAGALAVIGSHPHVLQPMQTYETKDGRTGFIAYSLGNFVSYQGTPKNRASVILFLGFTKTHHGTVINGVRLVPTYMLNRSGVSKIHLALLKANDKNTIGFKIIASILPIENFAYTLPALQQKMCKA